MSILIPPVLYTQPIALKQKKYKDLIYLVDKGIIPQPYVDFYKSLPCAMDVASEGESSSDTSHSDED